MVSLSTNRLVVLQWRHLNVSGALGVILSRYPYMTTDQARDVMLTTARQTTLRKGLEGKPLERWETEQRCTGNVWGWGILDLGKAMFGPGQFLRKRQNQPQSK